MLTNDPVLNVLLIVAATYIGLRIIIECFENYMPRAIERLQQHLRRKYPEEWAEVRAEIEAERAAERSRASRYEYEHEETHDEYKYEETYNEAQEQPQVSISTRITITITEEETAPEAETVTYAEAKKRLDAVQMRYANAHLYRGQEARYIFDAPAVFDVTVPATASYLDAVEEAKTCFVGITDLDAPANATTLGAVDSAENAWDAMVDFAQRNIAAAMDRPTRNRVLRLVNLVSHSSTDNAEAEIARDKLVDILSGITYAVPMVGGGKREVRLNGDHMFDSLRMRDMLALDRREPLQLEQ